MDGSASGKNVVIVGSSFAGLSAALEVRKRLDPVHTVTVLDPRPDFTFIPSLIWVPFGLRDAKDVTFPLAPLYERKGIRFVNEAAASFDLEGRKVITTSGQEIPYDRMMLGTGPRLAFERIPGLGPGDGYTTSVCNLEHALSAREEWDRFLEDPGPVVVGTAQGGSCFGASYEFLFNVAHRVRKAGLADEVPIKFVSAEPFLGHFGLGGVGNSGEMVEKFFDKLNIEGITNNVIERVEPDTMYLEGGRELPFKFSMIVPPFSGVDAIKETEGLANPMGFVPVDDEYRHPDIPEVFAAGVDIAIAPPGETPVPAGVPKTGHMSEKMAEAAAQNIAADMQGGDLHKLALADLAAVCVLDAGNSGVIFKAEHVLGDGGTTHVMAGPQAHWAKLAFERYFISSRKRGITAF